MKLSSNAIATVGGALVGAIAGYLFFTDDGRAVRRQLERTLEDAGRELGSFRRAVDQVAAVASEGRQLLNEVMSDAPPPRYPDPRQTSPF
jgi:hypothetical protein